MNLNRRVPVGLPGGVRGRKLFTFSYSIENTRDFDMDMIQYLMYESR